jgi:hypothetical protein
MGPGGLPDETASVGVAAHQWRERWSMRAATALHDVERFAREPDIAPVETAEPG